VGRQNGRKARGEAGYLNETQGSGEGVERKEVQLLMRNQKYGWIILANRQSNMGVVVAMGDVGMRGPMYVEEQVCSFV